ncbi:hypothetical protein FQZ97_1186960 [compost metagenome]
MRECAGLAQGIRLGGEPGKRCRRVQQVRLVVGCLRLFQAARPEPVRQVGMIGFPGELPMGERPGAPERLMVAQKAVQRLEALEQVVAAQEVVVHGSFLSAG